MKKQIILFGAILSLMLFITCHKKSTSIINGKEVSYEEVVTPNKKIDRNDIPPPPATSWWTIDTTNFDFCQQRIWDYLKTMYPVNVENYWDYKLYAIKGEPSELRANREFVKKYTHFFIDTIYSNDGLLYSLDEPCAKIDSTFFIEALGLPTCRSYHAGLKRVNYFYQFKLRYRRGPCAYIFDEGEQFEYECNLQHFDYCALLMMYFSEETGKLIYISFYGSG